MADDTARAGVASCPSASDGQLRAFAGQRVEMARAARERPRDVAATYGFGTVGRDATSLHDVVVRRRKLPIELPVSTTKSGALDATRCAGHCS